jgi:hypothetical protein
MYKRDIGILLLAVWAVFVSLRHEGPITFHKVRCTSSSELPAGRRIGVQDRLTPPHNSLVSSLPS